MEEGKERVFSTDTDLVFYIRQRIFKSLVLFNIKWSKIVNFSYVLLSILVL